MKLGLAHQDLAKRPLSVYVAGRSKDWVKIKTPIGREREKKRFDRRFV